MQLGLRVPGQGFSIRFWGLECRVREPGFKIQGLGFQVEMSLAGICSILLLGKAYWLAPLITLMATACLRACSLEFNVVA